MIFSSVFFSLFQGIIQYEGSKTVTKAVLQRRMFQNIIPEWIRQYESEPESSTISTERSHNDSGTFSSLISGGMSRSENCLEIYPDGPIFPSGILPEGSPPARDV